MQNRDSDTELLADSETRRMATIGSIEQYDPSSGDWEAYQERLEMFLEANAVVEGQQMATVCLPSLGERPTRSYGILLPLPAPRTRPTRS